MRPRNGRAAPRLLPPRTHPFQVGKAKSFPLTRKQSKNAKDYLIFCCISGWEASQSIKNHESWCRSTNSFRQNPTIIGFRFQLEPDHLSRLRRRDRVGSSVQALVPAARQPVPAHLRRRLPPRSLSACPLLPAAGGPIGVAETTSATENRNGRVGWDGVGSARPRAVDASQAGTDGVGRQAHGHGTTREADP